MEGGGSGGQRESWRWSDGGRDGVRGERSHGGGKESWKVRGSKWWGVMEGGGAMEGGGSGGE